MQAQKCIVIWLHKTKNPPFCENTGGLLPVHSLRQCGTGTQKIPIAPNLASPEAEANCSHANAAAAAVAASLLRCGKSAAKFFAHLDTFFSPILSGWSEGMEWGSLWLFLANERTGLYHLVVSTLSEGTKGQMVMQLREMSRTQERWQSDHANCGHSFACLAIQCFLAATN